MRVLARAAADFGPTEQIGDGRRDGDGARQDRSARASPVAGMDASARRGARPRARHDRRRRRRHRPLPGPHQARLRGVRGQGRANHHARADRRDRGHGRQGVRGLRHVGPDQSGRDADRGRHAVAPLRASDRGGPRPARAPQPGLPGAALHHRFRVHPRGAHPPVDGVPARAGDPLGACPGDALDRPGPDPGGGRGDAVRGLPGRAGRQEAAAGRELDAGAGRRHGRPRFREPRGRAGGQDLRARATP